MNLAKYSSDRASAPGNPDDIAEIQRLLMLADVAESVDGFVSLKETTARLCRIVLDVMDCDLACVRLPDQEGQSLRIQGSTEDEAFAHEEFIDLTVNELSGPIPGHRPPSVEAYLTGQLQSVPILDNETGELPWQRHTREHGIRSMVSLPLTRHAHVTGVLNCYWKQGFAPTEAQLLTLQVVGRLIALAIGTARRQESLQAELASHDSSVSSDAGDNERQGVVLAAQNDILAQTLRPASAAVTGILQSVSDRLRRSVVFVDTSRRVVASSGAPDQVRALTSAEPVDAERLVLTGPHGPLGDLLLGSPPENADEELTARLLDFSRPLLTLIIQRLTDATSSARTARPYALLNLCTGSLSGPQATAALDVLGIGSHSTVEIAVARCETPDSALKFASQTVHREKEWSQAIAWVATGHEAIGLFEVVPGRTTSREPLSEKKHLGLISIGLSHRFSKIEAAPEHLRRARFAASAGRAADVTRFSDLGPTADMCMYAPHTEVEAAVNRHLGPLKKYDAQNSTDLVGTLEAFVECDGSHDDAADRLLIHRNTVKQRLRKVAELTDIDIKSYSSLADIVAILKWNRYLEGDAR